MVIGISASPIKGIAQLNHIIVILRADAIPVNVNINSNTNINTRTSININSIKGRNRQESQCRRKK
jgi:hypothetical protein